jgi:hypothetical protein
MFLFISTDGEEQNVLGACLTTTTTKRVQTTLAPSLMESAHWQPSTIQTAARRAILNVAKPPDGPLLSKQLLLSNDDNLSNNANNNTQKIVAWKSAGWRRLVCKTLRLSNDSGLPSTPNRPIILFEVSALHLQLQAYFLLASLL